MLLGSHQLEKSKLTVATGINVPSFDLDQVIGFGSKINIQSHGLLVGSLSNILVEDPDFGLVVWYLVLCQSIGFSFQIKESCDGWPANLGGYCFMLSPYEGVDSYYFWFD